jgi:hypothetical protein
MPKKKPIETHVVHVVLKAPRTAAKLLIHARLVHDQMAENAATFPAPDPPLAVLQALIAELAARAAGVTLKGIGGADDRDAVHRRLLTALNAECAYVQKIAAADPKNAAAIAARAAMTLKGTGTIYKATLVLEHGPVSCSVLATAKAIRGATAYHWQYSLDGGATWIDLPMTTRADTRLDNLPLKATAHVRVRAFLRGVGPTDWCEPVSIIVT